jgi:hypothetical protein
MKISLGLPLASIRPSLLKSTVWISAVFLFGALRSCLVTASRSFTVLSASPAEPRILLPLDKSIKSTERRPEIASSLPSGLKARRPGPPPCSV